MARGDISNINIKKIEDVVCKQEQLLNTLICPPQWCDIVDLGSVSGTVNIDWSLGIKYRMTLTAATTINQTNFLPYEGQKVQELEITISNPATVITWGTGVDPADFTDAIDVAGLVNNVSLRLLRPNGVDGIFQSENLVN